jgi:hypothetical protein
LLGKEQKKRAFLFYGSRKGTKKLKMKLFFSLISIWDFLGGETLKNGEIPRLNYSI